MTNYPKLENRLKLIKINKSLFQLIQLIKNLLAIYNNSGIDIVVLNNKILLR